MCAQFDLKILANQLSLEYGIQIPEDFAFNKRVTPHSESPVITSDGLKLMRFSLIPSWSKESKVKFATHNARIESITEKATWRGPFARNHCLVPLTGFIEPIYENDFAGNMVLFQQENEKLLTAAGIYDSWTNVNTGETFDSFSIITKEPSEFISKIGHDRSPLFIGPDKYTHWLSAKSMKPNEWKDFLLNNSLSVNLKVSKDRAMRPGWEKRK